ncbi:TetR/AcrR family transcriptional regulator [Streptomyces sp. NPDC056500]|uniref:TetR/AcrR family transcriptional regulator n=1 Tax=Streptomyces sp. NPDC056500 TaxID=3345840 RepID=UPI00369A4018
MSEATAQPAPVPAPRAPKRRDKAATRAALLDAARRRFGTQGYDGTGVRDIAGEVGVDPALVFRYFGSKEKLYAEAVHFNAPKTVTGGPHRPITHITDDLLRSVLSCDQQQIGDEHPLLVMLRSAGRAEVREQLRTQVCSGYVQDLTQRLEGEDAALRAELMGALLLGIGVMRSIVESPVLGKASFEETRVLVARLIAHLAADQPGRQTP